MLTTAEDGGGEQMVNSELPPRANRRRGPGWWMDLDGAWRPPSEWPHEHPPVEGWERRTDGSWCPPPEVDLTITETRWTTATAEPEAPTTVEDQDEATDLEDAESSSGSVSVNASSADRRAVLLLSGAIGGAAFLLVVALLLITRAGADGVVDKERQSDVIYTADTDSARSRRRVAAASLAPETARDQLGALRTLESPTTPYVESDWHVLRDGCLDVSEEVLIARSTQAVTWAGELECAPDRGQWFDRNLGIEINRAVEAEVLAHVPPEVAHASGASEWTGATRVAFMTDTHHPATLQIIARSSGHNPRAQDPSAWKPSNRSIWCAYAVDWIAVKQRWELSVSDAERAALAEMLDTCAEPESAGADAMSMVIDEIPTVQIERYPTE